MNEIDAIRENSDDGFLSDDVYSHCDIAYFRG